MTSVLSCPKGPYVNSTRKTENKEWRGNFKDGIEFFSAEAADGDRELAECLTRKNMKSLPYWQTHPFAELTGGEATDEEFNTAMAKLQVQATVTLPLRNRS